MGGGNMDPSKAAKMAQMMGMGGSPTSTTSASQTPSSTSTPTPTASSSEDGPISGLLGSL